MENGVPHEVRTLRVPSDAIRAHQRAGKLPSSHQQHIGTIPRLIRCSIPRRRPNLLRNLGAARRAY